MGLKVEGRWGLRKEVAGGEWERSTLGQRGAEDLDLRATEGLGKGG